MTTTEIKRIVRDMTGYKGLSVRKGTGSLKGCFTIFSPDNAGDGFEKEGLKPFEAQLRKAFNVEIFSWYTVTIKA